LHIRKRKKADKESGKNLLKTEFMAKLSTREIYLRKVGNERRAMKKGKKYHFSNKKASPKFRKIMEANRLLIKQLRSEL
jgi:hypothetical protein